MNKDQESFLSLLRKIEKSGGSSAVKSFLASGGKELPTIKLTNAEMAALKGGRANDSSQWSPLSAAFLSGGLGEVASALTINPSFP